MIELTPKTMNMMRREARLHLNSVGTEITIMKSKDTRTVVFKGQGQDRKTRQPVSGEFVGHLNEDGKTLNHIYDVFGNLVWRNWDQIPGSFDYEEKMKCL